MLKVGRNSWHYRIWSMGRSYSTRPKNLCRYFWHIVFKVVLALVAVGLALVGIGALVFLMVTKPIDFLYGLGTLLLCIGIVFALIFGIHKGADYADERHKRILKGEITPKEPGMIRTFLKARKKKYCPLIEVVDD